MSAIQLLILPGKRSLFLFILCGMVFYSHAQESYLVSSIKIKGNDRTKESVILREISVRTGDSLLASQFDSLTSTNVSLLTNLLIFNKVSIFFNVIDSLKSVQMEIDVRERWFFFPSPIFELGDRTFTEFTRNISFDRVDYGIRLTANNLFGLRQQAKVNLQTGFTKKISLDYNIPYLNKKKTIGMAVNLTYKTNFELWYATESNVLKRFKDSDDKVSERKYSNISVYYRPRFFHRYELGFYAEEHGISDTVAKFLATDYFGSGRSRIQYISPHLLFVHDRRDKKFYPENGRLISAELSFTSVLNSSVKFPSFYFKWSGYKKISDRFVVARNSVLKINGGGFVPYFFYKSLGYEYKMRGYELYVIDGRNFVMTQHHLAYNFLKNRDYDFKLIRINRKFSSIPVSSYLRIFGDVGYVQDDQYAAGNSFRNKVISSFGLGIDLVTYYDNVFRFDISYLSSGFFQDGLFGAYLSLYNTF